jgi:thymidine phosphorylase
MLRSRLTLRMRAVDLIRKKRDSGEHSREEIDFLVSGYTRGDIPDYQMAAWLMAVWIRGMSRSELAALTEAMLYSGEVLNFSDSRCRRSYRSDDQRSGARSHRRHAR